VNLLRLIAFTVVIDSMLLVVLMRGLLPPGERMQICFLL